MKILLDNESISTSFGESHDKKVSEISESTATGINDDVRWAPLIFIWLSYITRVFFLARHETKYNLR